IADIVWIRPIVVTDSPNEVTILLNPSEDIIEFQIDFQNQLCAQGKLVASNTTHQERINLQDIQSRCSNTLDNRKIYENFQQAGYHYGKAFQSITKLYSGNNEALSHLILPDKVKPDFDQYLLHPSLMDGALQTSAGMVDTRKSDDVFIPFSIGKVIYYQPLPASCFAYASMKERSDTRVFDIAIVDEAGNVCIKIVDFVYRPIPKAEQSEMIYFQQVWQQKAIELAETSVHEKILLFSNTLMVDDIKTFMPNHIIVNSGDTFEHFSDIHYSIRPDEPEDYQELIRLSGIPNYIIHDWSSREKFQTDDASIQKALAKSFYSLFHLTQTVLTNKLSAPLCIIYVCPMNHPIFNSISAFAKTVHQENPMIYCKTIIIDEETKLSKCLLPEMLTWDVFDVRYVQNKREIKAIQETKIDENNLFDSLKKNGVYLITGGSGGIGSILTQILVKNYQARIALCGRKKSLDQAQATQLEQLRKNGADIHYFQTNLSVKDDVFSLVQQVNNQFGAINGVFHCAGMINDSFIIRKNPADIIDVLSPKIFGTLYLDEALDQKNLDFFVLFSSISAVLGNVGQCDYAFANSFMDHFALYRHYTSINWPLWENGGMNVDKTIKSEMSHMGILPLSDIGGLNSLLAAIHENKSQLIPIEGFPQKIIATMKRSNQPQELVVHQKFEIAESSHNNIFQQTQDLLRKVVSDETHLPLSKIDIHAPLEKYGIDSIMVVNLTNRLEKIFGPLSKTLFFEYQSLSELSEYFLSNHSNALHKQFKPETRSECRLTYSNRIEPIISKQPESRSRFMTVTEKQMISGHQDIAIIGIAGRYPMADDIDAFWDILRTGKNCITEIPANRFDVSALFYPDRQKEGSIYGKWGGFINDADKFDALFFNISPREAEIIDPQERLILETVWHTFENAGYTRKSVGGRKIGVYIGVMYGEYQFLGMESTLSGNVLATSSSYASIANRVSYFFNLHGPSMAVDSMCSSSLTSIHLACESLKNNKTEMAIAGGVNLSIHLNKYIALSQGQFLSTDGLCKSFGEDGDGYVPGEGVGAVLLKPLDKAIVDGDIIHAVIKGSAINHGGKTNGYSVPNPKAQTNLISDAIKESDINPRTINYLEAHGTGTALGDPIEITGLVKAYQEYTKDNQFCAIGSVKSNIGHLESAAGIAAITKVILQMQHKKLLPSLHSEKLNPNINFTDTPFVVQQNFQDWEHVVLNDNGKEKAYPLRAGVSSFGAGGSNAHIILEAFESHPVSEHLESTEPHLIVLSAKNADRLKNYSLLLADYLERHLLSLADVAYTLQIGREAMEERLACVVSSIEELLEILKQYPQNIHNNDIVFTGNLQNKQSSDLIIDEEDGKQFIQNLIHKRKLNKIGMFWVSGIDIDWQLLYDTPPKRISLPTYPFEKKRHWIRHHNSIHKTDFQPVQTQLHSLLHKNISTLSAQQFSTILTGNEFFLTDHVITNQKTLPGVAYLEMALAACRHSIDNDFSYEIADIIWMRPIVVNEKPKEVIIRLNPLKDMIEFQIEQNNSQNELCSQGKLVVGNNPHQEKIILQDIQSRCSKVLDARDIYNNFQQAGYHYGKAFQPITKLYSGNNEALSFMVLPDKATNNFEQYQLHPSLMDGALQTTAGIINNKQSDDGFMPFSIGNVQYYQPIPASCFAYASMKERSDSKVFDITIVDESGNVCIKILDFVSRPISKAEQPEMVYFHQEWKEKEIILRDNPVNEAVVIFDYATSEKFKQLCPNHITVTPGKTFKQISDTHYCIQPDNAADYQQLLSTLAQPPQYIIHLWSKENFEQDNINKCLSHSFISLFHLSKALLRMQLSETVRIIYGYPSNQPLYEAVSGFSKTLALETGSIQLKTISMSDVSDKTQQLLSECFITDGVEINYTDKKRQVRQFRDLVLSKHSEFSLKENGVYLITGGSG
ncbi:Beta-ketoacyl synthase, partial [Candidatus Magnetomorum sp. HK-1]